MIIGSERSLIERLDSSQTTLLVRAINDGELDQLLKDDSNSFLFWRGTEYETKYGSMVRMYSERRNGTVIVYPLQKSDTGSIYDDNRRFDINGWAVCVKNFTAPVEVYNVKGLNLEQLRELRKEGTFMDRVIEEIFSGVYKNEQSRKTTGSGKR